MGRNSLNGSIPAGFLNMPLARIIELNNNYFTGELPSTISGNVLEILSLNNNFIRGGIPGNCSPLTSVDFSRNNLNGKVSRKIPSLKVLSSVNLSRNHLKGKIPTNIQSMISIVKLDLSYNNLSGGVPRGGQVAVFKDDAFVGNPNLCNQTHSTYTSLSEPNLIQAFQQ
ncbi:hypothetical protein Cgig2_004360 [Carnegiea gigantea]|uniref:Uncharacterized protein n=1 Tax=Carnegiea gigantea TaxID=171969 RepID=A0A9Q1GT19_9CARY|nr:hypothetical protein Cgig2_004360 [Carnegiea gigantea]